MQDISIVLLLKPMLKLKYNKCVNKINKVIVLNLILSYMENKENYYSPNSGIEINKLEGGSYEFNEKYNKRLIKMNLEEDEEKIVRKNFEDINSILIKLENYPAVQKILSEPSFPNTRFPLRILFENAQKVINNEVIGEKGNGTIANLSRQKPKLGIIHDPEGETCIIHFQVIDPMDDKRTSNDYLTDFSRIEITKKVDQTIITCICYGRNYAAQDKVIRFVINGERKIIIEEETYYDHVTLSKDDSLDNNEWIKLTKKSPINDEDYP